MTDMTKYELNRNESILFYVGIVGIAVFVSVLFYKNFIFAAVIIPFIPFLKKNLIELKIERRREEYLIEFKDFLFELSTAIGAGRAMKEAIHETLPGLKEIYGEKSVLSKELDIVYERMEYGGENDIDVLMDMASASGMEDVIDFVTIYSICKTSGASLILALNKAATVIIDKMTIDKEIKELVKRKESEGIVIFVMPVVVIAFLNLCAPDYIAPLYESLAGRIIMTLAIACEIGIIGFIRKITNVEI